jgi:hypothetical protein
MNYYPNGVDPSSHTFFASLSMCATCYLLFRNRTRGYTIEALRTTFSGVDYSYRRADGSSESCSMRHTSILADSIQKQAIFHQGHFSSISSVTASWSVGQCASLRLVLCFTIWEQCRVHVGHSFSGTHVGLHPTDCFGSTFAVANLVISVVYLVFVILVNLDPEGSIMLLGWQGKYPVICDSERCRCSLETR